MSKESYKPDLTGAAVIEFLNTYKQKENPPPWKPCTAEMPIPEMSESGVLFEKSNDRRRDDSAKSAQLFEGRRQQNRKLDL